MGTSCEVSPSGEQQTLVVLGARPAAEQVRGDAGIAPGGLGPGFVIKDGLDVDVQYSQGFAAAHIAGVGLQQAAGASGYTRSTLASLVRDLRAGKLAVFAPAGTPGRKSAPRKDAARGLVIELRRAGLSIYEISARLGQEGTPLGRTAVSDILREEGFGRLLRGPEPESSVNPVTSGRDTRLPAARRADFAALPPRSHTAMAGLLLAVPDLAALDLPALAAAAGYPGTRVIPAVSWLLSLLSLKLTATRRVSHVDDLLADPAPALLAGLLAGLSVLPKKTALTGYSYRLSHDHQRRFLAVLDKQMITRGPRRARRSSTWTFTRSCTGATIRSWKSTTCPPGPSAPAPCSPSSPRTPAPATSSTPTPTSPRPPSPARPSPSATTGSRYRDRVKFATLRMRSPSLMRHIKSLSRGDFKTVTLDRPGPHNRPRVHEDPAVRLTSYPGTVRQLVITGLGRDTPTVLITNDTAVTTKTLIGHYARRMTIEQRLAEIIQAFCADALSSAVNLNADLDVVLCVLAQALLAAFRSRLPGNYAHATPDTLQRRFPDTPGEIIARHRRHHRQDQPARLLACPPRRRPPRHHRRPLVGRTPAPVRVRLTPTMRPI